MRWKESSLLDQLAAEQGEVLPRLAWADRKALAEGRLSDVAARLRMRGRRVALLGSLGLAVLGAEGVLLLLSRAEPSWLVALAGIFDIGFGIGLAVLLGKWLGTNRAYIEALESSSRD